MVGLLCSMQIPFVGFQPVRTSEHMAAAGIVHSIRSSFCLIHFMVFIVGHNTVWTLIRECRGKDYCHYSVGLKSLKRWA